MSFIKKVLNNLNGLHYPQDYLCLPGDAFDHSLHVYLVSNRLVIKDITNQHLFLGYCPLVFAFTGPDWPEYPRLIFSHKPLLPNEFFSKKDAIAMLDLRMVKKQPADKIYISYYEATHGTHHFLSSFHQLINGLYNQWFNKKPGNVFLAGNLYKQVQIAYSIPRNISLVTAGNDQLFNLFPTDLHGQLDEEHYLISLRVGGKASGQVEKAGKLVISQVGAGAFKMAYGLGKNHMQELKPKEALPFGGLLSEKLKWPLPGPAISYKELELVEAFTHGIHRIMLFRVVFSRQLMTENARLAHIHNCYATWRYKNGFPGNYLLR